MRKRFTSKWLPAGVVASLAGLGCNLGIAQNAAIKQGSWTTNAVVQASHAPTDQQLQAKVEQALRSDRYFYGAHVDVSVENGTVVLNGFVFSDWDLRDAIRIATKAASGGRVVDNLTIEIGGRR